MQECLRLMSICESKGFLWFVPRNINSLYRMDCTTMEKKCICDLDLDHLEMPYYSFAYEDDIWCVSDRREPLVIVKYNINSGEMIQFISPQKIYCNNVSVLYQGIIYSFMKNIEDGVLCFDLNKHDFFIDNAWNDACSDCGVSGELSKFYYYYKNEIYFTLYNSAYKGTKVLRYNLENKKMMVYDIKEAVEGIVVLSDEIYLVAVNERCIIKYNQETNKIVKCYSEYDRLDNDRYVRIIPMKKNMLIMDAKKIEILLSDSFEIKPWMHCLPELQNEKKTGSMFVECIKVESRYFLFPFNANMLLVLDEDFNLLNYDYFEMEYEDYVRQSKKKKILFESRYTSIETFLDIFLR